MWEYLGRISQEDTNIVKMYGSGQSVQRCSKCHRRSWDLGEPDVIKTNLHGTKPDGGPARSNAIGSNACKSVHRSSKRQALARSQRPSMRSG